MLFSFMGKSAIYGLQNRSQISHFHHYFDFIRLILWSVRKKVVPLQPNEGNLIQIFFLRRYVFFLEVKSVGNFIT